MALAGSSLISLEQQASLRTPEDVAEQTLKTMQLAMDSKAKEDQLFTARLVKARYMMIDRIGSGGFGSIFKAYDTEKHMDVAIKVEKRQGKCYLTKEVLFYATLERYRRPEAMRAAPRCHYSGEEGGFKIAVFDLMGESLSDLFYRCGRRFSLKCVLMLAQQLISRLESVHEAGIVHRDVKPGNFVMGRGPESSNVYVIDFGLSNLWRSAGKHIPFNTESPFRGTHRYASVNSHNKFEQSRRDDLEAIAYVLVYFCKGGLPWQSLKVSRSKRRKAIGKFKASISPEILCAGLPIQFTEFLIYVKALAFDQTPDYDYCRCLFRTAFENHLFENDGLWDWDLLPAVPPQQGPQAQTPQVQATPSNQAHHVQQQPSSSTITTAHRRNHPDLKQPSQPLTHQQAQALHHQHHQYQHPQQHNPGSGPHPGPRMHHFVATPQGLTAASQLQVAHQRQRQQHAVPHAHHGQCQNGGRVSLQQPQQHAPPHLMSSMLPILANASPNAMSVVGGGVGGRVRANEVNATSISVRGISTCRDFSAGSSSSASSSVTPSLAANASPSSSTTLASLPPTHVKLMADSICTMPTNPSVRPNVNLLPQPRISIVGNDFSSSSKTNSHPNQVQHQHQHHQHQHQHQHQQQQQQQRTQTFFHQVPQHPQTHRASSPQRQSQQSQLQQQQQQQQHVSHQQAQPLWSFLSSDRASSPVLGAISIGESSSTSCVMSNGSGSINALSTSNGSANTSPVSGSSTVLSSSSSTIPRSPTASPQPQHLSSPNMHSSIIEVDSEDVIFGNANSNSSLRSSSNTVSFATTGNGSGVNSSASNSSVTYPMSGQNEASFSAPSSNPESPVPMMPCLSTGHSMMWSASELLAESPFCHSASTISFGAFNNSANNTSTDSAPSSEGGLFVRRGSGSTSPQQNQLRGAAKKRARATAGSNPLPDPLLTNTRRSARLQGRSSDSSQL